MKRIGSLLLAVLLLYLLSGLFVVRGNEVAVVRRCGRALTNTDGRVQLFGSGLHWSLPWPFSQVDRVRLSEVRTARVCGSLLVEGDEEAYLRTVAESTEAQFLTGDKNILNLDVSVLYRISESRVTSYLYAEQATEQRVVRLAESVLADLVARSGVDFVHPLGLAELQDRLTRRCIELVEQQELGIEIESVTINSVAPPARVKANFLDVANARNDREKYINAARAYAEKQSELARAESQQILDRAYSYRQQLLETAGSTAHRFRQLLSRVDATGPEDVVRARRMALSREYISTLEAVLSVASGKVMLDGGREVDLTILKSQSGR